MTVSDRMFWDNVYESLSAEPDHAANPIPAGRT
jgi:hypothetical protein